MPNPHMRCNKKIDYVVLIDMSSNRPFVYCPQDPLHVPTLLYGEWFLVSLSCVSDFFSPF